MIIYKVKSAVLVSTVYMDSFDKAEAIVDKHCEKSGRTKVSCMNFPIPGGLCKHIFYCNDEDDSHIELDGNGNEVIHHAISITEIRVI